MSGGHFDYGCFKISQFADELQHEIDVNEDKTEDEYGSTIGYNFGIEAMARIMMCQKVIKLAGDLAKEIEWLYSSDTGEESFCEYVDKIMDECTKDLK